MSLLQFSSVEFSRAEPSRVGKEKEIESQSGELRLVGVDVIYLCASK